MTNNDIDQKIRDVLSSILQIDIPEGTNVERAKLDGVWDSLKHVEILFAIEAACDFQFKDVDEMTAQDSLFTLIKTAKSHVA